MESIKFTDVYKEETTYLDKLKVSSLDFSSIKIVEMLDKMTGRKYLIVVDKVEVEFLSILYKLHVSNNRGMRIHQRH